MSDFLSERRQVLENSFFAAKNKELLENLRKEARREDQIAALGDAAGIADSETLGHLVEMGIQAETMAALTLVPLLRVAWADRKIDEKERAAVLAAAAEKGVAAGSTAQKLLESWISDELPEDVVVAWREYMEVLLPSLSMGHRDRLRTEVLGRAEDVASATGGILGLGSKISSAEQSVIDDLSSVFVD